MKVKFGDKKELTLSLLIVLMTIGLFFNTIQSYNKGPSLYRGKVVGITEEDFRSHRDSIRIGYQELVVEVLDGEYKGRVIPAVNILRYNLQFDTYLAIGDHVSMIIESGNEDSPSAKVVNFYRRDVIYILGCIFMLLILLLGGVKGFRSLVSLMFIIALIAAVLLPLIIQGYPPIPVTVLVCVIASFTAMFLVAGFNKKAVVASIGVCVGALCGGILAVIGGNLMKVSGASTGFEQLLLLQMPTKPDTSGIFFSGIIIACLGAVIDVAIEISSSLYELKRRRPDISFRQLVESGMNIGRDVMGTMANTLVLVYIGSALGMFLYFLSREFAYDYIINLNLVASAFLKAISASIGVVLTIPATVLLGAYFYSRWWRAEDEA